MPISHSFPPPLTIMADGTIKQLNPFSGTEVWTVPNRANRPLEIKELTPAPLSDGDRDSYCAFCSKRVLDTPPEKSRIVRTENDAQILRATTVDELAEPWEFRRIPNLFEIVSFDYWAKNYGYDLSPEMRSRMDAYLSDPAGRSHVMGLVRERFKNLSNEEYERIPETKKLEAARSFFGGSHDLIVSRRHFAEGATDNSQLASSGTLTAKEHEWYMRLTIDAMHDIYRQNRYAKYVQVFQNWLKPSGASLDHLHKQLVAIDQRSVNGRLEVEKLRLNPNLYNEAAVDYAGYQNLVLAENKNAVAIAGVGHRYPTLEVWSRSAKCQPWEHSREEQRDMSDLIHAMHAATGPYIPCNEEWYCKPIDADVNMPWRVLLKWRVSTLAGFEGGSKIYVNTISPWELRDRVAPRLLELRAEGTISRDISIASECSCKVNSLKYNPALQ